MARLTSFLIVRSEGCAWFEFPCCKTPISCAAVLAMFKIRPAFTTTYSLIKLHSLFANFSRVATNEVDDRRSLESRLQKSKERWLLICVIWRSGEAAVLITTIFFYFLFQQVLATARTCKLKFSCRQLLSTTRFHVFGNLESQLHLFTNVTQMVYCENHVAALSTTSMQRNPDHHYRGLIWKGSTLPGWICKLQSTNK